MIKEIVKYGDKILRTVCEEYTPENNKDKDISNLISNLKDTLESVKNGAGLASPQIGVNNRVFVTRNYRDDNPDEILTFINPEIVTKSKEKLMVADGCLSIPNIHSETERHSYITVSYLDENFNRVKEELEGFQSVVFQHELDHLDGILFLDLLDEEENVKIQEFILRQKTEPNIFYIEGKIIEMSLKNG